MDAVRLLFGSRAKYDAAVAQIQHIMQINEKLQGEVIRFRTAKVENVHEHIVALMKENKDEHIMSLNPSPANYDEV